MIENLKSVSDGIGRGIDGGIVLTVAALNCHGFETTASCEGHSERACPPRVDFQSREAPKLLKIMQDGPHTGQGFIKNRNIVVSANRKENCKLFALLNEYYRARSPQYQTMLTIVENGPGYGRLVPHASYLIDRHDKQMYDAWLQSVQAEFNDFTNFLCNKLILP